MGSVFVLNDFYIGRGPAPKTSDSAPKAGGTATKTTGSAPKARESDPKLKRLHLQTAADKLVGKVSTHKMPEVGHTWQE